MDEAKRRIINDGTGSRIFSDEGFIVSFSEMAEIVHSSAIKKGFWYEPRNSGEIIALIHSELSEALEALRTNKFNSEHIPGFSGIEEELTDAVIRIMDFAAARRYRLAEAIVAKIAFNEIRPMKHGKAF